MSFQNEKNSITFLNHSALIVESGNIRVLCDPWFIGTAFNNGWRLLFENSHDINDIDFNYIWISHEHPDHFSIPTLSQINKSKHFLYQHDPLWLFRPPAELVSDGCGNFGLLHVVDLTDEFGWRHVPESTVRPTLVVVDP